MSQPRPFLLSLDSWPTAPAWIKDFVVRFNEWSRDMRASLAPAEVVTFDWLAAAGGVTFKTTTRSPALVQLVRCREAAPNGLPLTAAVCALDWELAVGGVRVRSLPGLTNGTTYTLVFLVTGA